METSTLGTELNLENNASPSVFPLLHLPAELRNRVSKLVLTAEEPLLCAMVKVDGSPKLKPKLVLSSEDSVDEAKGEAYTSYNQLKFVNRQLRHETEGLELRLNVIRLPATRSGFLHLAFPPDNLVRFHQTLAPSRISWLKKVILKSMHKFIDGSKPRRPVELAQIAAFCKDNPRIEVRYVIGSFDLILNSEHQKVWTVVFFGIGALLSIALQNNPNIENEVLPADQAPTLAIFTTWVNAMRADALIWRSSEPLDQLLLGVRNLAIFPGIESIDDEKFTDLQYGSPGKPVSSFSTQQQQIWLKWMKLWIKDGIRPTL